MKTIRYAAIAALLSTSFITPAFATAVTPTITQGADEDAPDMQAICDANYVDNQTDPSVWRSSVTGDSATAGASTAIAGSDEDINPRANTGSTWSYVGFLGTASPLTRTGGSPNLWGYASFDHTEWDNTLVDVQTDFEHSVTYAWSCFVEQYVDHPEFVPDPPSNPGNGGNGGDCTNNGQGGEGGNGQNNNNNQQNNGNGGGNEGCGNGNGGSDTTADNNNNGNGGDNGCGAGGEDGTNDDVYAGNSDHVCRDGQPGTVVHHYSWDPYNTFVQTSVTHNNIPDGTYTTQVDVPRSGHVTGVDYVKQTGPVNSDVRILSCISPGSKGGSWKAKDYYHGPAACSTANFNAAGTAAGRTFDSPPTASLPGL